MRKIALSILFGLPFCVGCVGTTKAAFTLNKTIDLDQRPLEGAVLSFKLEWIN